MKRARPQGIGSAAKKAAVPVEDAQNVPQGCKAMYMLPESATALDEVKALFEDAYMSLDDYGTARSYFNGVVNECSRLECIRDMDGPPEEEFCDEDDLSSYAAVKRDADRIFCADFYLIYGETMRMLAELYSEDFSTLKETRRGMLFARKQFSTAQSMSLSEEQRVSLAQSITLLGASMLVLDRDTERWRADVMEHCLGTCEQTDEILEAMMEWIEFRCMRLEKDSETDGATNTDMETETEADAATAAIRLKDYTTADLESKLPLLDEFAKEASELMCKRIVLQKIDIALRLALIDERDIEEGVLKGYLERLEALLVTVGGMTDVRQEILLLKGSILELLEDEGAAAVYKEANRLSSRGC